MPAAAKKSANVRLVSTAEPARGAASAVKAALAPEAQAPAPAAPIAEVQQTFRNALEKGVIESRAAFTKAKTAADETAGAIEVSFAAAKDGALAINAKTLEAMRANADANFDFWKATLSVKSLPDLITLQTEFARKQVETIASQTKDFGAMAQKAMADAVAPIKEQVAKSFKMAVV